jgi:hypothetical protein
MATRHPLYKIKYSLSLPDPMMPQPRHHTVLFVPLTSSPDSPGTIHHVIGDLVSGMAYASRSEPPPEKNEMFFSRELLGFVSMDDYPKKFEKTLREVPAPPVQRKFRVGTMKVEQIKSDGTFYKEGEARDRMWKCTEWIEEFAIPKLRSVG